jgi:tRNA (mo5U34)-methyltransferase
MWSTIATTRNAIRWWRRTGWWFVAEAAAPADLRGRVATLPWWHTMELAPGIVTPGRQGAGTARTLRRLRLPARLDGKSFLDVGAWDGCFAFEAERRGAARVLATDRFSWDGGGWGTKAAFDLAREALGSQVESLRVDPMELSPERVGRWDVVLLAGVLYHVSDPLELLRRVAAVTSELLIVETHVEAALAKELPILRFRGIDRLDDDPTNFWAPNRLCVEQMLQSVGFQEVTVHGDVPPDRSRRPAWKRWLQRLGGDEASLSWADRLWLWRHRRTGRMAFHARKPL